MRLNKQTERWGSGARDASASAVRRLSIFALICLMAGAMIVVSVPPGRAAGTGQFDHIVILAMENQDYSSVFGSGTGSSTAPFLSGMLPYSSTIPNYHSYGEGISGCSAACYTAVSSGGTWGVSDGVGSGSVSQTSIFDQLSAAGLTWKGFCENGCPRGGDHYPSLQYASTYQSPNSVITSTDFTDPTDPIYSEMNSASPANYIWLTPTDSHNMHDNSVSSGDAYAQQLLVGSGTINSPAPGSVLATGLFTNSAFHTLLYIWWDEYDPSPNLQYGKMIQQGYISQAANYDEYSTLHMIEANWGLTPLAAAANDPTMSDLFGASTPLPLSTSFTFLPTSPLVNSLVTFTALPIGGVPLYTVSWIFGDGSTATGTVVTHTYTSAQSFTVTETAKDSSTSQQTATSSNPVTVVTALPLATTFTVSSNPVVNLPATFLSTTTSGTGPYTISWNFGDGSTGSGASTTHTYTTAQAFTVTETAKDSSSQQQTATSTSTITVSAVLSGNFGTCTSLPQGWSCGNTNGLGSSSVDIVSGVLETVEANPGVGNDNSYYYSTSQKGVFPWSPCQAPVSGAVPTGTTSVSSTFTPLMVPSMSSGMRYHIYIALYYWLPDGAVSAGGSTYRCLDTQVRVENIGGTFSSVGSTGTYNPGDSFGWDQVTLDQVDVGQTYTLTADVANQCQQDLAAWGLNPTTPCQLAGIEIGTEGFGFQELDVNFYTVQLTTSTSSLVGSFVFSPSGPQVGQPVSFTGSASGGTPSYSYAWIFGDGSTGTGRTASHSYSSAGTYTATLTVADAIGQTAEQVFSVAVHGLLNHPPSLSLPGPRSAIVGSTLVFAVNTSDLDLGEVVTLVAAGLPSSSAFDPATGHFSWTPSANDVGSYTVTFTATDNGSPPMSAFGSVPISVETATSSPPSTQQPGLGSCSWCNTIPIVGTRLWLFVAGGFFGFLLTAMLMYVRANRHLAEARRIRRFQQHTYRD